MSNLSAFVEVLRADMVDKTIPVSVAELKMLLLAHYEIHVTMMVNVFYGFIKDGAVYKLEKVLLELVPTCSSQPCVKMM